MIIKAWEVGGEACPVEDVLKAFDVLLQQFKASDCGWMSDMLQQYTFPQAQSRLAIQLVGGLLAVHMMRDSEEVRVLNQRGLLRTCFESPFREDPVTFAYSLARLDNRPNASKFAADLPPFTLERPTSPTLLIRVFLSGIQASGVNGVPTFLDRVNTPAFSRAFKHQANLRHTGVPSIEQGVLHRTRAAIGCAP